MSDVPKSGFLYKRRNRFPRKFLHISIASLPFGPIANLVPTVPRVRGNAIDMFSLWIVIFLVFTGSWQKRWFTIEQAGNQYVMKYYKKEEDAGTETIPQGVCELETVNKFEITDGMICFEAFQVGVSYTQAKSKSFVYVSFSYFI